MLFREVEVVEMIDIFKAVHNIQNQIPKFVFTIFVIIQNVLIKSIIRGQLFVFLCNKQ